MFAFQMQKQVDRIDMKISYVHEGASYLLLVQNFFDIG